MRRLKVLRLTALLFLLTAFTVYQRQTVVAQENPWCDQFWSVGGYWGQEVECMGDWTGMMCEAICDYCFGRGCNTVFSCNGGGQITVVCQQP